ncbi:MAG TPA: SAM-dependent methyltransferase [Clostridiales bacterium UBA8960]|nr:SAM-dependent methyltransferase [Clostridiales bacterium UBA8960]
MIKDYYNKNASDMIENTLKLDLQPIYEKFEKYLKPGAKLLDVGFGSGRDSLHFDAKGFEVVSIDFAQEVYNRGKILLNTEVLLVDIRDIKYKNEFEGIWASAVLFHYDEKQIIDVLVRCRDALKDNGIMYVSFKYGQDALLRHGRFFNDFDEVKFEKMMSEVENFDISEIWKTQDARGDHRSQYWLNVILTKK